MAESTHTAKSECLWLKPMETSRRSTDKSFILLLPLGFLLWLGIGICEFNKDDHYMRIHYPSYRFYPLLENLFKNFAIFGWTAVMVTILILVIFSKLRDNWAVSSVTSLIITIILTLIVLIFWQLGLAVESNLDFWQCALFIFTLVYLTYHAMIFICTKEIGKNSLGPMITEPFRAITHSLVGSLFPIMIICLLVVIFIITAVVTVNIKLLSIKDEKYHKSSSPQVSLIWMRIGLFALAGTYIFNIIWNFGLMVMGNYFAYYFSASEKQKGNNVLQSIARVTRYHVGSVCFLSIPILPSVCAFIVAFKNNQQFSEQSSYKFINFVNKICLIINIPTYALLQIAIYGHKSLKSITEMFDLQSKSSPSLFLTLNAVPFRIAEISTIIAIFIGIIQQIPLGFFYYKYTIEYYRSSMGEVPLIIMGNIVLAIIYVNFIIVFFVRPAVCTFTIYKMTSRRESKISEDQLSFIEQ